MNNTKIIHIVNDLQLGGVSTLVFDLLKNHKSSKYEYVLVNLSGVEDENIVKKFNILDIQIYNYDYKFESGYSLKNQFQKAFFKKKFFKRNNNIIQAISTLKPDILHFHTLPRELMLGSAINDIYSCKLVYTDHLARVKVGEIKSISRILLPLPFKSFYKGYHVIAVGVAVVNYLKSLGIDKTAISIRIINNKIPENSYRINYEHKDEYKVVYVARISAVKGHLDLINAWKLLPEMNLNLFIIGPDELSGSLHRKVKELDMKNNIFFTGSLDNVAEFIKDADMGLFPSHKEGLPIALLEKMQIGIPCIVSDIEELTSIVTNNFNGLVYKCGDSKELAEKIIILAEDIDLKRRLGTNAAKLINEKYVSKLGGLDKEYEEFYNKILI